jgi:hypothetical protein
LLPQIVFPVDRHLFPPHLSRSVTFLHTAYIAMLLSAMLSAGMMAVQGTWYTWLSLWCTVEGPGEKHNGPQIREIFERRHAHISWENFPRPEYSDSISHSEVA